MTAEAQIVTTVLLLATLILVVSGLFVAQRLGLLALAWNALCPDFIGFTLRDGRVNTDRGTNRTLHLLGAGTLIFMLVLAGWALSAGLLRTAWLYSCSPDGFAPPGTNRCLTSLGLHGWGWGIFVAVLLAQMLRAVGAVLAIAITAGLLGAAFGFLFGIPRYEARETPAPQGGQTGAAAQQQAAARLQLNTNLIKVSDWLTNGIVVLSLVEAKAAGAQFLTLTAAAAAWLFDSRHGSPALIAVAVLGSAVFGFLYGTVYTQLIITRLLAAVDATLLVPSTRAAGRALTQGGLLRLLIVEELLAPQISRSANAPDPPAQPSPETLQAAHEYDDVDLEDLTGNPDVTFADILNWSRAKALLNNYAAAARGYLHLLGMRGQT